MQRIAQHTLATASAMAATFALLGVGCSSSESTGRNAVGGGTSVEAPSGGTVSVGGSAPTGGVSTSTTMSAATGGAATGGSKAVGGSINAGSSTGGTTVASSSAATGGSHTTGGASTTGGANGIGGSGGRSETGGAPSGGAKPSGGSTAIGGTAAGGVSSTGGAHSTGGASVAGGSGGCNSGPIGTITGALATGIAFVDTDGKPVNAHGGGIIKEGDTYYMHGEYFLSTTTDNAFNGFSMYSSKDLATWKNEGIILPQQASGELGPNRKGERPHIIKCPSTGEFVLYAHAASADYQTDKEVVYATSQTVNGKYSYKGPLTNSSGTTAAHSDMSALTDGNNAYVITESGHVYTLSTDCHSWLSDKTYSAVNGDSGGSESPTVFKAGSTYYWIGSYKTGWRANNNFYSTAPAMAGPWTFQGPIAPVSNTSTTTPAGDPNPPKWISNERTWLSQSTWVQPVVGCKGTVYVFWGDHWYGTQDTTNPGKHNDQATYVFQPLVFDGTSIFMPTYHASWKLDVGYGTWTDASM